MRPVPQKLDPSKSEASDDGQEMLDGLPIPAAVIGRETSGPASILRANDSFRSLVRHDERLRGPLVADVPLLGRGAITNALRDVLGGSAPLRRCDDVQLAVRVARLSGTPDHPDRCLLTLIETGDGDAPASRPASSRDPLTGLPNRRAFEERVAEVLSHPNFAAGSHALLTVTLGAAEPEIEADGMLIAGGGRLLSALRAGDLLARSGERSFAILMRLEKGWPDAAELAERLRAVLATPVRLSSREASLACSVQCSPLA